MNPFTLDDEVSIHERDYNPLECRVCSQDLVRPVRLPCQHCCCFKCAEERSTCIVCECTYTPQQVFVDKVLDYVVASSHEPTETCANCDNTSQPMRFCATCQEPLCSDCVRLTHSAKMFSSHHISLLEERGRQRGQPICNEHRGAFVLFCQETKKLMCIECFNATSLDKRHSFVNIDVAHKKCRERLDESVVRLRAFQDELLDQIDARKRVRAELESKMASAELSVVSRYEHLTSGLAALKEELLDELRSKSAENMSRIERQLRALENMQGPIRTNLLCASVFCSYASHLDLLHRFSEISRHFGACMTTKTDAVPTSDDGDDVINACERRFNEFLRANFTAADVDDSGLAAFPLHVGATAIDLGGMLMTLDLTRRASNGSGGGGGDGHDDGATLIASSAAAAAAAAAVVVGDELDARFSEQLQRIDGPMRTLTEQTADISTRLLDLQRDITLRRCVVNANTIERLAALCADHESQLAAHARTLETVQVTQTAAWSAQATIVKRQQLALRDRAHELVLLQQRTQHALTTSAKLWPLALYLASVIETVRPAAVDEEPPMESICRQIQTLMPDSQSRVDAIEKEAEQRRLTIERERRLEEERAAALKKRLRSGGGGGGSSGGRKPRPTSAILVDNNRERDDSTLVAVRRQSRASQRRLGIVRASQSDDAGELAIALSSLSQTTTSSSDTLSTTPTTADQASSLSPLPIIGVDDASISADRSTLSGGVAVPDLLSNVADEMPKRPAAPPLSPQRSPRITTDCTPTAETMHAHDLLMQSIKARVKRID